MLTGDQRTRKSHRSFLPAKRVSGCGGRPPDNELPEGDDEQVPDMHSVRPLHPEQEQTWRKIRGPRQAHDHRSEVQQVHKQHYAHQNYLGVPAQEERGDFDPANRESQRRQIGESDPGDDHEVPAPDIGGRLHLRQDVEACNRNPQSRLVNPKELVVVQAGTKLNPHESRQSQDGRIFPLELNHQG